jgi:hypothetical protein
MKVELQKLADETGLRIAVCHFPAGTSQRNKIEHRLFSFISQNWRGKPLIGFEVIVNLIAATNTEKDCRSGPIRLQPLSNRGPSQRQGIRQVRL